jgi:hypothetical protein
MTMSDSQNIYSLKGDTNEDIITEIDLSTGFINATKMCKSAGKFWGNYYENKSTKDFIRELCIILNCKQEQILSSKKGGGTASPGTWVHSTIATNLASWCSAEFGAKVSIWIEKAKKEILPIKTEWNISIENIKPSYSNEVEQVVRDNLSRALNGIIEVESTHGFIDIMTNHEIIEVKYAENYKSAIGQILSYSQDFPSLKKRIHLYHSEIDKLSKYFTKAKSVCDKYDINITCEIFNDIDIEKEKELELEKEKTKQLELQLEVAKKNRIDEERELEKELELELEKEKTRQLELQLEVAKKKIKKEQEINEEKIHPIKEFIDKHCEIGQDIPTNKYRITIKDLYKAYTDCHNNISSIYPLICEKEFNNYLTDELKMTYKACNWTYHTYMTWFNIRLKEKQLTLIQKLIKDFIDNKCVLGKTYLEDTKLLYNAFEKYAITKGFDVIKKNGFSPQNFRAQLFENYNGINIKKWAINRKTHAFTGIKLASTPSLDNIVKVFVEEQCLKGYVHRAKNVDLLDAFNEFIKDKYVLNFKRIEFYNTLHQQNPELIKQHVTQSHMGFVGISLKNTVED